MHLPGVKVTIEVKFTVGLLNLCKQAIPAPPQGLGEMMSHSPHLLALAATFFFSKEPPYIHHN